MGERMERPVVTTATNNTVRAPIGLFYGSSTCYTEMAAEKIQSQLGDVLVDLHNIAEVPLTETQHYAYLIFGIPTWDYGELQEDWESVWPELDSLDMENKPFAIFGLGDQIGYPEWFLDAAGYLHDKLVTLGGQPVGYWPTNGYQFQASKALTANGDQFVCLALDEENEFEHSEARIQAWCETIKSAFDIQPTL